MAEPVPSVPVEWESVLDLELAMANVRSDMAGDWYRDPWGWPEYDFVMSGKRELIYQRLDANGARRAAKIDVAKENFATRPAIVMEPLDRLAYQALVDRQSKSLIGDMSDGVYGWRLPRAEPMAGHYARNDRQWEQYREALKFLVALSAYGLKTDIVSCFASLPVDRLLEEIVRRAGGGAVTDRIADYVDSWAAVPGRPGLVQRSAASAVLANMFLMRLDAVITDYSKSLASWFSSPLGESFGTRWMDDIWVFGSDPARLRHLQVDLQDDAREAGLELNAAKTKLLEGEELASEALKVEHSAVDEGLGANPRDLQPLEALVEQLLASPELADRTSIRFVTSRLRKEKIESKVDDLLDVAHLMPQGADHLARLARDFRRWSGLHDWYLEYVQSSWARIEWSAAQLGTMFPSKGGGTEALTDYFATVLQGRVSVATWALATQRLAAWSPGEARAVFRAILDRADHPLERRLLALAAHSAGEERDWIKRALSEYEENKEVLLVIEDRAWTPVKAVPDFAASAA
jgi:hypothetical protein